jgi:hypothetical protein
MGITRKDIDTYFKLGKKIKESVIHLSKVLADNGFEKVLPGHLVGSKWDFYICPSGNTPDDIKYLDDMYNDPAHEDITAITPDGNGGTDSWDVPCKLLVLGDKALLKKIDEMKEAQRIAEEKERKAKERRERREAKKYEKAEYERYLKLKEKFEGKTK